MESKVHRSAMVASCKLVDFAIRVCCNLVAIVFRSHRLPCYVPPLDSPGSPLTQNFIITPTPLISLTPPPFRERSMFS